MVSSQFLERVMMDSRIDLDLRESLFQYVDGLLLKYGDSIPHRALQEAFQYRELQHFQ